jgi:tetratricopeptide (TPR) repeat protein
MKRVIYLMLLLSISAAGFSQTISGKARNLFASGTDKVEAKNYSGAIEDLTMAITLDPGFKQAYENRGVARFYLNDLEGAIADYTKALEIDPDDCTTHGRRGWAKFYKHDYKGAIEDLNIAVTGSKDKYRYFNFRGESLFRLRDFDGAIADFNTVIGSSSAGKDQKGKAFYWRGMIELTAGNKETGCADLEKARKFSYPMAEGAIKEYCGK